ncbi:nucleoside triphosphate pyrophosphohydrolase [Candidatus Methylospira mobilis]|uniref:nucleoside triphosphate pyrophosphohydrolase n=1 Tax=Candidatus Methylospira mobilis TaxID=1808979 RepID=UPI0028E5B192|nr:nucleoside triphosphate pyrophosphohydrolase [Candidatus Methylospira mobilis]WNV05801.1 nucleoside triphosphate pyrophosphohydrolase [Candidatus Methylospira mobilis]
MENTRRLIEFMALLRDPAQGCPWDLKQDFASLLPYTIEEAYEVADAVEREDYDDLRDELGDLLLHVAFHSRIAEERGLFDFEQVAAAICSKLVRRHPHVFQGMVFENDEARIHHWEQSKELERSRKLEQSSDTAQKSALSGVANTLPALMFAQKLQTRAARQGFDWPGIDPVFEKVQEELRETREAFTVGSAAQIEEELGDLLFSVVNLARHLHVDAETALRAGSHKFSRRYQAMERLLQEKGKQMADCSFEEMDLCWEQAKRALSITA